MPFNTQLTFRCLPGYKFPLNKRTHLYSLESHPLDMLPIKSYNIFLFNILRRKGTGWMVKFYNIYPSIYMNWEIVSSGKLKPTLASFSV